MDPEKSNDQTDPTRRGSGPADFDAASGTSPHAPREPSTSDQARDRVAAKKRELEDYDPEEEIWTGGYSGRAMLGTWIGLLVLSIAAIVGTIMLEIPWLATGIGLLVIWVIAGLVYAARRLGVHYELTSQRFIHKSGIVTRHTDRIEVIDIDDVSYQQGPIQRMLGVGSIEITSSDRSHPELRMVGIADVKSVAGLIDDIRRTERRRRSLHIESI